MREKKGKGAKLHPEKKRQGGKTSMSEISVLSTNRGYLAPPRSSTEKMTKNKNFKKNSCEKKKRQGGKLFYRRGGINPTTSVKRANEQ